MPQPINREAFVEILKTRCIEFTREEIRDLMNEELEKDPDEMDLKVVDYCLDALEGKFDYLKEGKGKLEQEPDIMRSIDFELAHFEYNHGCLPEKIFVSYPLLDKISVSCRLYPNGREKRTLRGIPVQLYDCDEVEFYLAERKGSLRKFYDDTKQIFKRETIQNDR